MQEILVMIKLTANGGPDFEFSGEKAVREYIKDTLGGPEDIGIGVSVEKVEFLPASQPTPLADALKSHPKAKENKASWNMKKKK